MTEERIQSAGAEPHQVKRERERIPLCAWFVMWRPDRVAQNLDRIGEAVPTIQMPNVWQVGLAVLRMWHRLIFRSDTVGLCKAAPVRAGWRARLLQFRPVRFGFLWANRAIAPLDLSGLASPPERLIRHLVGTHHDGAQFMYDLEILSSTPGMLEALHEEVTAIVLGHHRKAALFRDLVVYEGYHEALLERVESAIANGVVLSDEEATDPDISLRALLAWCVRQPRSPGATWRAWWRGDFRLGRGVA